MAEVRRTRSPSSTSSWIRVPGPTSPESTIRASGSWTRRWMVRLSGRAPKSGSKPSWARKPGGGVRGSDLEALVGQQPVEVGELDVDDLFDVFLGETVEDQDLIDAIEKLGPEVLLELRLDQGRHPIVL